MADEQRMDRLRARLHDILVTGLADEPMAHARQVAEVAGVLHSGLAAHGFVATLVGGSAIEIHAPGIYMSGDLDLVIEGGHDTTATREEVFRGLGLERIGRHWRHGDLFVETVPGPVAGPAEEVEVGGAVFRIVLKEVPLRDRIVGFKHWRHTAYGDQATAMLIAFGQDLDMSHPRPLARSRRPAPPAKVRVTDTPRDPSRHWIDRLERIRRYRQRSNTQGMTRPPRDPDEREFLRETGQEGPYVDTSDDG